ncbi:MAG: C45 family peptidase [Acidobacteriia bacterium]|nr:C45 family peptidase [Terriglobia bacterium]
MTPKKVDGTMLFLTLCLALMPGMAAVNDARACTTAVISGQATANGRPLLWKNRDADNKQNQVVYDATGRYPFVGVVNSADPAGLDIWAGINAQGFAIMNSQSYNLDKGDSVAEGQLMRMALQSCATVEEFQALLAKTDGGRDVTANFGVIDARGGAAIFEAGRKTHTRFDATDPKVAPNGFIVRSNFSDSGDADSGSGFLRRERANSLLDELVKAKALGAPTLLSGPARDVANVRIGSYPAKGLPEGARWAYTADSVCRFETASVALFEGVRPGEDPLLATLWVIVGQPITGAAVPVWVRAAAVPASLAPGLKASEMTKALDAVRTVFYPETRGELKKFIRVDAFAASESAVVPCLLTSEAENFRQTEAALATWRTHAPTPQDVAHLQDELAARTLADIQAIAPKAAGK